MISGAGWLTRRRTADKEIDLRPERDKILGPSIGVVAEPPKAQGLEKPKY
jgi:hypothetical protein